MARSAAGERPDGQSASEIVARLREGDGAALDLAFSRYRDRLFGFLVRLGGRRDLAEDLLQETFLQLARHALRLAPDTDLAAWLFTVARNAFFAQLRRAQAAGRMLAALPTASETAPDDPERALSTTTSLSLLRDALLALPEADRELLLLAAEGELSSDQAAAILAITPAAFRKRLERARDQLARRLAAAPHLIPASRGGAR